MTLQSAEDRTSILTAGVERLNAGKWDDAAKLFKRVLEANRHDADALHLLGLAALQQGRPDEAVALIGKAAKRRKNDARILNNLGEAYRALGRHGEAAHCYRRAVALDARDPAPHNNLGNVLAHQSKLEDAAASYRRALAIRPDDPEVLTNLGDVLRDGGRPDEAIVQYERALAVDPGLVETHVNLGNVLAAAGDVDGAMTCYRRAVAIAPDDPAALTNLGNGLQKQGDDDAAMAAFERALELKPDFVEALSNLGSLHQQSGRLDTAVDLLHRVIGMEPDHTDALNCLGLCRLEMGMVDDAMAFYRRAIARRPDDAMVHNNYGMALMRIGRFAEAWTENEWRWLVKDRPAKPTHPQPEWQGQDLAGKTILVWGEQGVGDELLYAGMVPDLIERGARVVLQCEHRLVPLFLRSFAGVRCIAARQPPAAETRDTGIDFQVATGSLGRWLRPSLASFPGRPSYLVADPARCDACRTKYRKGGDIVVGVAWISKNPRFGHWKSMTLRDLAPLATVPGITFVDLQYGDTAVEREAFETATGTRLLHDDNVDQMASLDDFAAQVAAMDLVIAISNTTVHMAGALGVPAWVMVDTRSLPCWMQDREDSPWYPSLRLFRQRHRGDWPEVIGRIAASLRRFAG